MLEMAAKDKTFREFVQPTGVEIIKAVGELGGDLAEALNCCNGRVGKRINTKEIIAQLSGAGD